jgi:hypothetical protein
MLYTLALFATEPIKWINKYEWRSLTELEICAIGVFWKSVGDAMMISYEHLPSAKSGFTDGLSWLEELSAWRDAYESEKMVPNDANRDTADATTAILLYSLPISLKPLGRSVVTSLLDERLRKAVMLVPSPAHIRFCCRQDSKVLNLDVD